MRLDAATETHLALVHPAFAGRMRLALVNVEHRTGRLVRITEALRSFKRQALLFMKGRTIPGPNVRPLHPLGDVVTNAMPGFTIHHYGCAADVAFAGDDPYLDGEAPAERQRLWGIWVDCVELAGMKSGGDWKGTGVVTPVPGLPVDLPHAEFTFGMTVVEMKRFYDAGGVKALWERFDTLRGVTPGEGWADRLLYDPNPKELPR